MEDKELIQCAVFFMEKGNASLIISEKKNSM